GGSHAGGDRGAATGAGCEEGLPRRGSEPARARRCSAGHRVIPVSASRPPGLGGEQLRALMRKLHAHAGIRIDSTERVIAGCIQARMAYLGLEDVDSYLRGFADGFNGRAEWMALIDLLTVKETRFFR